MIINSIFIFVTRDNQFAHQFLWHIFRMHLLSLGESKMHFQRFKTVFLKKKLFLYLTFIVLFYQPKGWSYSAINSLNDTIFKQKLCKISFYFQGASYIDTIQINYLQKLLNNEHTDYSIDDLLTFKKDMEQIKCEQYTIKSVFKTRTELNDQLSTKPYPGCNKFLNLKKEIDMTKQLLLNELTNYSMLIKKYFENCSNALEYCKIEYENINTSIQKMNKLNLKLNELKDLFNSNKTIQVTDSYEFPIYENRNKMIPLVDYFLSPTELYISSISEIWNKKESSDVFPFSIQIDKTNNMIYIRQEISEYELCIENKKYILNGKFISSLNGEINSRDVFLLNL